MEGSEQHDIVPILRPAHHVGPKNSDKRESEGFSSEFPGSIDMTASEALRELEEDRKKADFKITGEPQVGTLVRQKMKEEGEGKVQALKKSSFIASWSRLRSYSGCKILKMNTLPLLKQVMRSSIQQLQQTNQCLQLTSMTEISPKEFDECKIPAVWPATPLLPELAAIEGAVLPRISLLAQNRAGFFNSERWADCKDSGIVGLPDLSELSDFKDFADFFDKPDDVVDESSAEFKRPEDDII